MSLQVSTLYRRGVVRPLDENAAKELLSYCVESSIRCEWLPILDEHQFELKWKSGVFQAISEACRVRLTDYDDVTIEPQAIGKAIEAVASVGECGDEAFKHSLRNLLIDALRSGTGVLFVL